MTFANPLPWWVVLPAIATAALVAYRAYLPSAGTMPPRWRFALIGLRFGILLLLLLFFMRPVVVLPAQGTRDAVVAVLIDASRSMRIADADGDTRLARAISLVGDTILPSLEQEFTVELHTFGDQLTPADLGRIDAGERRSDLQGALLATRERYGDRALAGVVVVSDGGDTGVEDVADGLAFSGEPVFAVGVGSSAFQTDREVLSVTAGAAPLEDSVVQLNASVVSHGFADTPFEVRVLENGRSVHVRRVSPVADGSPIRAVFQVSPAKDAATVYTIEIPHASSELVAENNRRSLLVEPPGRRRRVLLLQGAPGYEHSFLLRTLASDSGLETDTVVRKGANDVGHPTFYVQATPDRSASLGSGFPESRAALFGYDALILANVSADLLGLTQLQWVSEFVSRRGGGLLVLGGLSFAGAGFAGTPVADLLPLDPRRTWDAVAPAGSREPNRLIPTAEGAGHPTMQVGATLQASRGHWAAMPALGGSHDVGGPRAGASVLAVTVGPGGGQRPLVAAQRYGRGRSMVFAGEGAWRWRMMVPIDDRTYETFWRQTARWLATSAPTRVAVSMHGGATAGDTVTVDVQARDEDFNPVSDASVRVRVAGAGTDDEERVAALVDPGAGLYRLEFRAEQAGVYRASAEVSRAGSPVETQDGWMLVGGDDRELTEPRRNDEVLQRIADASGGRVLGEEDLGQLGTLLRDQTPGAPPARYRDLWHGLWTFLLIVSLLSAEWVLRRQAGLR